MDLELLLNASDEDLFEVPESPGVRSFRQPCLRSSVSLIPASRPSSSVDDGIVEPSIPSGSRGSISPAKITYPSTAPTIRQDCFNYTRIPCRTPLSPVHLPTIFRVPGVARDDIRDVTARRSARRTPSSSFPPPTLSSAALTSHAYTSHHPSIPSSSLAPISAAPSLPAISAAPPPAPTSAAGQTAQTAGPNSSTSYTQPFPPLSSFHPPCLLPYPPPPHHSHSSITCTTAPAPPYPTASHTANLGLFLAPAPPSSSYTLATAQPPVRPLASARPSPVSPTLRQQILTGNYIDLAQLIHPTSINPHIPRELLTLFGPLGLKPPLPARSKDLTVAEFAFAFSLYRDIICSAFPDRRSELDDYLSLILDLALRFGGNGFYTYHILFASQAAGRLQQFNQGTYWGTLDHELYCRVFAARTSLHCETCGAPSHPAAACTLSAPLPPASVTDKQSPAMPYHLPSAAPPPSITPKPALDHPSILGPLPKGTDRRGRPVLYQGGRMICNNFNILGCSSSSCKFLHTCSFCGGAHARATCSHNPAKQQL
ncbi:protein transport protein SEC31-like [Thunnus maccoyii]|uniref:protein transport protein SEC31-like n=1 Tax=Thunnus maccoyii TaxID=8240 RepID=UPI001C4D39D7|nr:protein transport protein SEC31-like [Thunnus maccoyii]